MTPGWCARQQPKRALFPSTPTQPPTNQPRTIGNDSTSPSRVNPKAAHDEGRTPLRYRAEHFPRSLLIAMPMERRALSCSLTPSNCISPLHCLPKRNRGVSWALLLRNRLMGPTSVTSTSPTWLDVSYLVARLAVPPSAWLVAGKRHARWRDCFGPLFSMSQLTLKPLRIVHGPVTKRQIILITTTGVIHLPYFPDPESSPSPQA